MLTAAVAGLGAVVAPEPYAAVHGLVALEHARGLAEAWRALPVGELWLVGHRALREVPRIAAVWEFLVEMFQRAARPA